MIMDMIINCEQSLNEFFLHLRMVSCVWEMVWNTLSFLQRL